MTIYEGNLLKMKTVLDQPVQYTLVLNESPVAINSLIGSHISIHFSGRINCIACGRSIKKAYGQGFCYPCFINSPQNAECIIRPELCKAHLGEGRDVAWEEENHMQPHIVYLALTDAVKVGVTRKTQVPTRWIDQGAWKVIPVVEVPYRYLAGKAEVALKDYFTDKTNWRNMLRNKTGSSADLQSFSQTLAEKLPDDLKAYYCGDCEVTEIHYPVEQYPDKVKSLNLGKSPEISGTLAGIRGQYMIFDDGRVFNVRNHSGYYVQLAVG